MPLSKKRDKARKRLIRLERVTDIPVVQPKTVRIDSREYRVPELDADGEPMPEYD